MSRYFPHTPYAEDQPLSHTILTSHVIARTITLSNIIAAGITTTRQLIPALRPKATALAFTPRLIQSASTGTVIALGLGALMTLGRMHGREEIEWQDRSWRLMENKGQLETDDWTVVGAGVGAALGARAAEGLGWRGAVGGLGLGTVGGMLGYMAWRYGVNGGKFPKDKDEL
ncbi:hypothetical protein FSOLCH5_010251 [Fusarium solani]|jgi:phosphoglycerate dehydrogenase-like enzyme|uniref:Uncharacterized protein n=1 Tax=Fusarium solani TaxID=169388 RepID=A0A9P9HUF4_FUSSL|nr:uncharacterized protein B0J15DRAFT_490354 [Fusarium solani]KAH7264228.1 hypothetical protein B0J15DRAFT_490354 [Fusarium solani]KAJ3458346.1 hypothetical protein MRS44_012455 [Fusarium solani]KAJ4233402.1 hypothetical protein NW759_002179 [Fusarium solani]